MAGDLELVVDRHARLGHPATHRLADLLAQLASSLLDLHDAGFERCLSFDRSRSAMAVSLAGHSSLCFLFVVERRAALGAIAVDGDRLEPELPALDVGVHDVLDRRLVREVHRLGDRAAEERLRRGHHVECARDNEANARRGTA